MLTKEKVISAIQAMPENEFEDIEVLLGRIVELGKEEQEKTIVFKNNQILQEPPVTYKKSAINDFGVNDDDIPSMIKHIDQKIEKAIDIETIYLLKKIRRGLENSMAGNYFTVEEVQAKIDSWFKK